MIKLIAIGKNKDKALEQVLADIEKQFGAGAIMKLGDNEHMNVDVTSSGSLTIDIALGVEINIPDKKEKASCIRFIQSKNGILKNVSGINDAEKIENVFKVHFNGVVGKKYDDVIDNSGRVGYVITKGDDAVTALNACNKAIDCIKVEYEDRCNNE